MSIGESCFRKVSLFFTHSFISCLFSVCGKVGIFRVILENFIGFAIVLDSYIDNKHTIVDTMQLTCNKPEF